MCYSHGILEENKPNTNVLKAILSFEVVLVCNMQCCRVSVSSWPILVNVACRIMMLGSGINNQEWIDTP